MIERLPKLERKKWNEVLTYYETVGLVGVCVVTGLSQSGI